MPVQARRKQACAVLCLEPLDQLVPFLSSVGGPSWPPDYIRTVSADVEAVAAEALTEKLSGAEAGAVDIDALWEALKRVPWSQKQLQRVLQAVAGGNSGPYPALLPRLLGASSAVVAAGGSSSSMQQRAPVPAAAAAGAAAPASFASVAAALEMRRTRQQTEALCIAWLRERCRNSTGTGSTLDRRAVCPDGSLAAASPALESRPFLPGTGTNCLPLNERLSHLSLRFSLHLLSAVRCSLSSAQDRVMAIHAAIAAFGSECCSQAAVDVCLDVARRALARDSNPTPAFPGYCAVFRGEERWLGICTEVLPVWV